MIFLRFFVCIVFLVSSVLPFTARAQSSENIVLLPLQVPPSLQSKRDVFAAAIQNALRDKFNVFYGSEVEEALRRETAKTDCSAISCVQNLAVEFNGEIVVDTVIDQLGSTYVLSIKFNNVITGELEESILSTCDDCSDDALFRFVQQQALSVDLNPESDITALLETSEQSSKPAKEQGKLDDLARTFEKSENPEPQPEPKKDEIIAVPQQSAKRKAPSADFATEKEGLSWWVYGLPLLALGGGGGGGGGDTSVGSAPTPTPTPTPDPLQQIEGDVVKGPLRGATVFLDYNDNGTLNTGEPFTLTDNNGSYSFQVENANAAIVVVTDENTVDTSSGEVMSGLVLKAPQGSTVITPVTTLFADGDMTEAEVRASLGIAAEVDIKSFNPFKAESGSQVAVKLEKLALQIVSSANAIAKVAQDEGVDQFEASKRAFASIIESIEDKSDNGEQFDFTAQDDLTKIREKAESELGSLITLDADTRTALRGAMETAKSTIETIENLTSLDDEASQNIFRNVARIKGDIENKKSTDSDNDGIPDFIDFDRDNDGVEDFVDLFPDDASESADLDGDGTGDNSDTDRDGDGVANGEDAFPSDASETTDLDGDGTGDNTDGDRDGDGLANGEDAFPSDASLGNPTSLLPSTDFVSMGDVFTSNRRSAFENKDRSTSSGRSFVIGYRYDSASEDYELGSSFAPNSNSAPANYSNLDFDFQTDESGDLRYSAFRAFYNTYDDSKTFEFDYSIGDYIMLPLDYDQDGTPDKYMWNKSDRSRFVVGSGDPNRSNSPQFFWFGQLHTSGNVAMVHDGIETTNGSVPEESIFDFSGFLTGAFIDADDNVDEFVGILADVSVTVNMFTGSFSLEAANSIDAFNQDRSELDFAVDAQISGKETSSANITFPSGPFAQNDDADFKMLFYGENGEEMGGSFSVLKLGPLANRQKGQWYAGAIGVTSRQQISTVLNETSNDFDTVSIANDIRVTDTADRGSYSNYNRSRTSVVPGETGFLFSGGSASDLIFDIQLGDTDYAYFEGSSGFDYHFDTSLGDQISTTSLPRLSSFVSTRGGWERLEVLSNLAGSDASYSNHEAVIFASIAYDGTDYDLRAFSGGNETPSSSVDSLAGVNFSGQSVGIYLDGSASEPKFTTSDVGISFSSESSGTFTSSNTKSKTAGGDWADTSALDFSLKISGGSSNSSYMFVDSYYNTQTNTYPSAFSNTNTLAEDINGDFFGSSGGSFAGTFNFYQDQKAYMGAHSSQR
jgi:hypothetical protein